MSNIINAGELCVHCSEIPVLGTQVPIGRYLNFTAYYNDSFDGRNTANAAVLSSLQHGFGRRGNCYLDCIAFVKKHVV